MNIFRNSVLRAVVALIVGVLLIKYPDHTLTGLTVAIGILFLVAGILSLLSWLYERRRKPVFTAYDSGTTQTPALSGSMMFPLVGLGSLLLGAILTLMPETFIRLQVYFVAALLILGALNIYMNLIAARTYGHVSFSLWLFPSVILLAGVFVLLKPMESASLPLVILGWSMLLFGVTELVNAILFFRLQRVSQKDTPVIEAEAEEVTPQ